MAGGRTRTDADILAREIVERVGPHIRLALPLGLGKAVTVANALTRLAEADPSITLDIFTALTLERPIPSSDLQQRFLEPAMDRLFGAYPGIRYADLLRKNALPANIRVSEFFFQAGNWLGKPAAQAAYIPANYTMALDYLLDRRPNVIAQLLAEENGRFSLSCNTDITVDLLGARRRDEARFLMVGEVNGALPFMDGSGEIAAADIDLLLDNPETEFELFSAVKQPVSLAHHAIGLHVSRLIPDGGTLQIGIGQIGDAVASALLLRQERAAAVEAIWRDCPFPLGTAFRETGRFRTGLYAVTEMLVEGILALFEGGVVKRKEQGAHVHAGFFLDSRAFYRRLRELPSDRRACIAMMPVSFTNQLYGGESEKRAARRDARFVNAAMKVTLLGAAVSDSTRDGQTVSGVGGQYDFVAQAHALKAGRSIIAVSATRKRKGRTVSNIVWDHPHQTIPHHLRDIVVTEYGIADLRGRSDEAAILALVGVADSRFQADLLARAKSAGKVHADATVPQGCDGNRPDRLEAWLGAHRGRGCLEPFPFGTDFTALERRLLPALERLRESAGSWTELAGLAARGVMTRPTGDETRCLGRLSLTGAVAPAAILTRLMVQGALAETRGARI